MSLTLTLTLSGSDPQIRSKMIILILCLFLAVVGLSTYANRLERRVKKLERSTLARIEQASHAAFYDGFLYANQCHERRHPRDPKTKQFVSRT